MKRPEFNTLRAEIRHIVDGAERRLAQPEIYAELTQSTTENSFCVTIAYMLRDKQLSRRRATKAVRAANPKVRSVYGPGPKPVIDAANGMGCAPRKAMGFMALKREREAQARRRAAA